MQPTTFHSFHFFSPLFYKMQLYGENGPTVFSFYKSLAVYNILFHHLKIPKNAIAFFPGSSYGGGKGSFSLVNTHQTEIIVKKRLSEDLRETGGYGPSAFASGIPRQGISWRFCIFRGESLRHPESVERKPFHPTDKHAND